MTQARRIKQKPKKKAKAKTSALVNLPWGLIFVILVSSAVLFVLFKGSQSDNGTLGQGLKSVLNDTSSTSITPQVAIDEPPTNSEEARDPMTDFDYYDLLPDIEKVMPDDLPEGVANVRRNDNVEYFLQVASFRNRDDAESVRAKLALQGLVAVTQAREVADKGLYYRVRLGPFANQREAKNARARLQKMGHDPFVFQQTKE